MTEKRMQRIFGITILILVVCIIGIGFLFESIGASMEEYMAHKFNEEQLRLTRHVKSQILDHFHNTETTLASNVRRMTDMGIPSRVAAEDWPATAALVKKFKDGEAVHLLNRHESYIRFAIVDRRGRPLLNLGHAWKQVFTAHEGPPVAANELFHPAGLADSLDTLISKPHIVELTSGGNNGHFNVMDVSVPLLHNGKLEGRVIISVNMAFIEEVISDYDKEVREYDHRWIFDRQGNLIYCSLVMSQEYHQDEITALREKGPGAYEVLAHGGQHDLLSIMPMQLGGNDWLIVAESNFEEVMGLVHELQRMRSMVVVVLLLLVVVGGFILYRLAVGKLVAEQKLRMGEALAEEETKFKALIEAAPDPIFILDEQMTIEDANSAARAVLGPVRQGELTGTPFTRLLADAAPFEQKAAALHGEPGGFTIEHAITIGGATLHFENNTSLLKKAGGGLRFQVYLRNITEHRRYEAILRSEKEKLDSIVTSVGAGIAIFRPGAVLEWSNSRYRELFESHQTAAGDRCSLCETTRLGRCPVMQAFDTGLITKEEMNISLKEGEQKFWLVSATPVRDAAGAVDHVIELIIDITENRNLESQLLQSEKLASIGELAAGIAHELNNPMSGIIGYSEFLMEELKGMDEPRRDAEKIHGEAVRCSKIVQNLLKFARRHKPQQAEVQVNDILEVTTDIVEYEFKVNNVVLEKIYEPALKTIIGDQYQLQQVFLNILNNAFFFLKDQPGSRRIRVTTANREGMVEVRIWNNGPKIPDNLVGKIFDPFFTTKDVGKGTGLGLSVSHGIVQSHKGNITAQNVADGVEFAITLPELQA